MRVQLSKQGLNMFYHESLAQAEIETIKASLKQGLTELLNTSTPTMRMEELYNAVHLLSLHHHGDQ